MTKIADRPDDDEPITPELVFSKFPSMGPQYSARCLSDLPQLEWHNRFERFVLYKNPQPQIKTRGDCRRLCAALWRPLQDRIQSEGNRKQC